MSGCRLGDLWQLEIGKWDNYVNHDRGNA